MKAYERRAAGAAAYPYFKLATWDARSFTFRDGKVAFAGPDEAKRAAEARPGRYRISRVDEAGRTDLEPFAT